MTSESFASSASYCHHSAVLDVWYDEMCCCVNTLLFVSLTQNFLCSFSELQRKYTICIPHSDSVLDERTTTCFPTSSVLLPTFLECISLLVKNGLLTWKLCEMGPISGCVFLDRCMLGDLTWLYTFL